MKQIAIEQLQANHFYWARRRQLAGAPVGEPPELEVIRISTIFGSAPEFRAVAVSGSEEHFGLEAFEYLHKVPSPPMSDSGRPNLVRGAKSVAEFQHPRLETVHNQRR